MSALCRHQSDHKEDEQKEGEQRDPQSMMCGLFSGSKKPHKVEDIDFRGMDLRDQTLDGMWFRHVDFSGADLRGANFSDCIFEGCLFEDADLSETCLASSIFEACEFFNARFSGTIITEALFSKCHFFGPSVFTLSWLQARIRPENFWYAPNGEKLPFVNPIMMVRGLDVNGDMVVLGDKVIVPPSLVLQSQKEK